MNLVPRNGRLIVRPDEPEKKTASGIILAPDTNEPRNQGMVMAVDPDQGDVTVGEKVLWIKFSGTEFMQAGVKYLMLDMSDVLGVLEEA